MSRAASDQGFSLVESLVALGVFAMAGVGLVQLQSHSLSTFARVEQRALADMVAQNRLTELVAARATPALGAKEEDLVFAGRTWRVVTTIAGTQDGRTRRVSVAVNETHGGQATTAYAFVAAAEGAP